MLGRVTVLTDRLIATAAIRSGLKCDECKSEFADHNRNNVNGVLETETYLYDSTNSNRLNQINRTAGANRRFTYDAAGNVICASFGNPNCEGNNADGDMAYTYNDANRMETVTKDTVLQARYTYNHLGQQVKREIASGIVVPGVIDLVIHNIFDLDGNRIAEYDATNGTPVLIREYIWQDGVPVAVVEGGATYYVRTDHIGRPVFATDDTGTMIWETTYLPFGGVHTNVSDVLDLRFPGQWFQAETGLHQNWMRDYDPTTGRYLQPDPLGLIDGASVYGYAAQNPLRYTDPTGEAICGGICIGAALWAGGMLLDYALDDGCYTMQDFAISAAINAPWLKGYQALKMVGGITKAGRKAKLAKAGDDLFVGTYNQARRGLLKRGLTESYTPHHVVQNAVSRVSRGRGVTITIRKGLHEQTRTYSRAPKAPDMRTHLARDIQDLRRILRNAGYDRSRVNRQLRELIQQNRANGGFRK